MLIFFPNCNTHLCLELLTNLNKKKNIQKTNKTNKQKPNKKRTNKTIRNEINSRYISTRGWLGCSCLNTKSNYKFIYKKLSLQVESFRSRSPFPNPSHGPLWANFMESYCFTIVIFGGQRAACTSPTHL